MRSSFSLDSCLESVQYDIRDHVGQECHGEQKHANQEEDSIVGAAKNDFA
jgi:hypothetical protein